jgi:hypothetical protein
MSADGTVNENLGGAGIYPAPQAVFIEAHALQ